MCGIAGIFALESRLPPARDPIERMVRTLRHRGPDAFGLYRDRRVHLGHTRLSIVDLAGGDQPMSNEDGRLWCVFNGELFNHLELREELSALGHRFRTRSDTEVLVHAFEAWGDEAFRRFNGQWAVALWDSASGTLTLSRDPVGIRPLYVCEHAGRLYFASEVKALFAADPRLPRRFDPLGLAETFTFWSAVAPRTVFEGVEELEAGTLRSYGPAGRRRGVHWRVDFPGDFEGTLPEAATQLRGALERASQLQALRSDVPVGAYLSGGLDSAITATLAREVCDLTTFSISFEDKELDESPYQELMAKRLGTRHHTLRVRGSEIAEELPAVVRHAERPLLRTAPAPLFLLSRRVREAGFKVVLTGEGADELFAGYDLFREDQVRRFWARRPDSSWRPRLLDRLYPYLARSPVAQRAIAQRFFGRDLDRALEPAFSHGPRWSSTRALHRLFGAELTAQIAPVDLEADLLRRLPPELASWKPLARAQALEIATLLSGYLLSAQGDRMLMAHSVEGRFPFLDPNVIALASRLPPTMKLRGLDEKHVLKRAFADLPREILSRPKQPYRGPDASFLWSSAPPEWAFEVLSPGAIAAAGVFDSAQVSALIDKSRRLAGKGPLSNVDAMALIGVATTQLVHRALIARAPELGLPAVFSRDIDRTDAVQEASA
jgi:asparagine synthase (glutamine-hydrolysing)